MGCPVPPVPSHPGRIVVRAFAGNPPPPIPIPGTKPTSDIDLDGFNMWPGRPPHKPPVSDIDFDGFILDCARLNETPPHSISPAGPDEPEYPGVEEEEEELAFMTRCKGILMAPPHGMQEGEAETICEGIWNEHEGISAPLAAGAPASQPRVPRRPLPPRRKR